MHEALRLKTTRRDRPDNYNRLIGTVGEATLFSASSDSTRWAHPEPKGTMFSESDVNELLHLDGKSPMRLEDVPNPVEGFIQSIIRNR